jgi:2'-5' RNA ligase
MSAAGPAPETMRAFIALNLDVESVRAVTELSKRLRDGAPVTDARWVASTKLHLTLKFLGTTDVGLAPALVEELAALLKKLDRKGSLSAYLGPLGAFPSLAAARVLTLLVDDGSGDVGRMAAAVDERVAGLGFAREARAYQPHVTLARLNRPLDTRSWLARESFSRLGTLTELVLYRSDQARSGAEYTTLARWPMS